MPRKKPSVAAAPLPKPFNRKQTDPSRSVLPADANRYRCSWLERGVTIQSDGNVTCGLDDPYSLRSFGNIKRQPLAEIWANPEYERLQRKLWDGHKCAKCNLAQRAEIADEETLPARPSRPTTLVVETTVRCNLRCPQPACIPNNDRAIQTRDGDFLDLDAFRRAADDLAGNLSHVFFFNYGDPFVHAGADEILAHLHRTNPDAHVVTSTNGIPLSNLDRARRVVAAGALNFMMFTISGVSQESYGRYHVGGRLDLALRGMANVIQAKRELGLASPIVHWRYLVFHWNDSEAEIEEALRLAADYGVDEFSLHLTHVPLDAISFRFSPGSPNFVRYRKYINNALGYTRHAPMPDEDGFYAPEGTASGVMRWTSWQARKRVRVAHHRARLTVSTNRPGSHERTDHVLIVTPWETVKVPLQSEIWRSVELTIPDHLQLETLEVEIVTFDHWFPAEVYGGADRRCLGVMVLEEGEDALPPWRESIPLDRAEADRLGDSRYQTPPRLVDW
ncbi:hypothetical protein sos41_43550 [Alphaproteobacteria bacterium SO-S41]|nr:hypothetical protein sos41_43550 [Alphaproteobacteria bacterium SO-S41]